MLMKGGWMSCFWLAAAVIAPGAERLAVNEMRAPQVLADLRAIEQRVTDVLPRARAATVAIDLGTGSGSGVIVSEEGLILSAAHVTGGVGKELTVIFEDGRKVEAISLGLNSESDAALAKITEEGSYPSVPIDREGTTELGDWVFALGHAGGFDEGRGSVVRLGRVVGLSDRTMHTDCNLIGGDSGGPLFDLEGQLIGIHSRVGQRLPQNMHVPAEEFLRDWDALNEEEFLGQGPFAQRPEKGSAFLGVSGEPHEDGGLVLRNVAENSPAAKAGLTPGDVLTAVDGNALKTQDDLIKIVKEMAPGERIALEVYRGGRTETLTLRLGERTPA